MSPARRLEQHLASPRGLSVGNRGVELRALLGGEADQQGRGAGASAPRGHRPPSLRGVGHHVTVTDTRSSSRSSGGDALWTPFHFGFELDEQLGDRLSYHRFHEHHPDDVLGARFLAGRPWSKEAFEATLRQLGTAKVTVTPAGRQVSARGAPFEVALQLFAALLPLGQSYPLPYVEVTP